MTHHEWYRASASGEVEIYSQMYSCDNPKAIIQIAHGMSERSGRYKDFMEYLAENGYAVCANDHLGHGWSGHRESEVSAKKLGESEVSAKKSGEYGVFAKKPGGFDYVIEDMHTLFEEVCSKYPDKPCILLGQSMGSILAALFADRYHYLSKLILMGTPEYNSFVNVMAKGLRRSVDKHGYSHASMLWNRIIWGNEPKTRDKKLKHYSWLTADEEVVEKFLDDPLCGHPFSDASNLEMMEGLVKWGAGDWGKNIADIPILFITGLDDKIAGYGKGTRYYYNLLVRTHRHLTLNLIEGNRHEVLQEKTKKETYQYILLWLEKS